MDKEVTPPPEVLSYYDGFPEESRLELGPWKDLLDVARALESEPSVIGVSAHLLGIGRRP